MIYRIINIVGKVAVVENIDTGATLLLHPSNIKGYSSHTLTPVTFSFATIAESAVAISNALKLPVDQVLKDIAVIRRSKKLFRKATWSIVINTTLVDIANSLTWHYKTTGDYPKIFKIRRPI